ncbi:MAG: hypothetical protein HYT10_01020 [Candidatus Levybacteria bacterium]|nr:hypothetical protein [Candidatus Levybacteria bacterium]
MSTTPTLLRLAQNYLEYKLSTLFAGKKYYEDWKIKNYHLRKAVIKNKLLAKELETACQKNGGILTYNEFIAIDQFGKNGYHATHGYHGITGSHKHWAQAVFKLAQKKGYSYIVEVGSADGSLAIDSITQALKSDYPLFWTCVEINASLQKETIKRFKQKNLTPYLKQTTTIIDNVRFSKPCIGIFSYTLDSIAPEILWNSKKGQHTPDTILGITVKNGLLEEIILTKKQLSEKGISLTNGIYTDSKGIQFDIRSWNLYKGQRAYLSLPAFSLLASFIRKIPLGSMLLIIDEFRPPPAPWHTNHFLFPKDLLMYKRECENIEKTYEYAGEQLFYFPSYLTTTEKLIQSLGCNVEQTDTEQKLAHDLSGRRWLKRPKMYFTYALLTSAKKTASRKLLPVEFPKLTLL